MPAPDPIPARETDAADASPCASDAGIGELVRLVAAGDEAAFTRFYEAWYGPTLALARVISRRDEAFALDVVQDVMTTVVEKLPPLRDETAVRAWMVRTVANTVTDHLRAEARRQRREEHVGRAAAERHGDEPWLQLVADERAAWLQGVLDALPAIDRELVAARYGTSTTVAAAAAGFGLGADAAHGRLRRALQRLRRAAEEWWHG